MHMGGLTQVGGGISADGRQVGLLAVPEQAGTISATALVSGRQFFVRFVPKRAYAITLIAFAVTTASGTDDACDAGIYDNTLTRLGSAGATTGKLNSIVTPNKTLALTGTVNLKAGSVYYASFASASTATLNSVALNSNAAAALFGASPPQVDIAYFSSSTCGAGPITPTGSLAFCPLMALRES